LQSHNPLVMGAKIPNLRKQNYN